MLRGEEDETWREEELRASLSSLEARQPAGASALECGATQTVGRGW